jgi:hypothetical protein
MRRQQYQGEMFMKTRSIPILAALVLMMASVAVATPKNKKTIYLSEPTIVSSVTLQPGNYTVEWNGAGPDVEVSFSRGKNTVVTAPATLEAAHNPTDSVMYRSEESGAHLLLEIQTKSSTLRFVPRDVISAE